MDKVEEELRIALLGAIQIGALRKEKRTMTYSAFARVVGILSSKAKWNMGHMSRTTAILKLIDAVGRRRGEIIDFSHIIDGKTKRPGVGIKRKTVLVTTNLRGKKAFKRGYPDGARDEA